MPDVSVLQIRLYGKQIGALTRVQGDRNLFAFNQAYVDDAARPTLSLSFRDALGGLITELRPTQDARAALFRQSAARRVRD